jgi:signal transduction histidine kinase
VRATVDLALGDQEIRLVVTDDGRPDGRAAAGREPGPGHGITGMRERIAAFGGLLEAGPLAGQGFRVSAQVPVDGPG